MYFRHTTHPPFKKRINGKYLSYNQKIYQEEVKDIMYKYTYGVNHFQSFECIFGSLLDVSSIVIVPISGFPVPLNEKNIYPCMFFDPALKQLTERRGVRIRLQDTFPNIRENRNMAWICADFAKYLFEKLDRKMTARILYRTPSSEFIARIYSSDASTLLEFVSVFLPDTPSKADHISQLISHQMTNFGEVCINDILQASSEWFIESNKQTIRKHKSGSV